MPLDYTEVAVACWFLIKSSFAKRTEALLPIKNQQGRTLLDIAATIYLEYRDQVSSRYLQYNLWHTDGACVPPLLSSCKGGWTDTYLYVAYLRTTTLSH